VRRAVAVLLAAALVLLIAALAAGLAYRRDMARAYQCIGSGSMLLATPYGEVEYASGGSGAPVLVVHGSGGGFDQGRFLAEATLGAGTRWIAPSRFGYLRSTFVDGATFDEQAHAYAHLLDHLGIRRVAVLAFSHGGPSALLFALLHPERVSSLTLLSCGVASDTSADQAQAHVQGTALMRIFQADLRYWALTQALRGRFLALMGADAAAQAALTPAQRALVDALIDGMNPVSPRAAGTVFDNRARLPDARIAGIRAPTLVLHARDDTLQLYRNAEYAAATIPGARLVPFERGGHVVLALEQQAIRGLVAGHIAAHAGR
jgi:pimeloyl-ACP methyl ester carboxylesterase